MNEPTIRACIFWGASNPTREHVIPLWLADVIDSMEPGADRNWRTSYSSGGLIEKEREHRSENSLPTVVVRHVCETCNSERLSAIEGQAKALIESMVRGR